MHNNRMFDVLQRGNCGRVAALCQHMRLNTILFLDKFSAVPSNYVVQYVFFCLAALDVSYAHRIALHARQENSVTEPLLARTNSVRFHFSAALAHCAGR